MSESFRVRLDELRFLQPVTAGLNLYTLIGFVPMLRDTNENYDPILVTAPCEHCRVRQILDGRHRVIASIAAGRHDILAVEGS